MRVTVVVCVCVLGVGVGGSCRLCVCVCACVYVRVCARVCRKFSAFVRVRAGGSVGVAEGSSGGGIDKLRSTRPLPLPPAPELQGKRLHGCAVNVTVACTVRFLDRKGVKRSANTPASSTCTFPSLSMTKKLQHAYTPVMAARRSGSSSHASLRALKAYPPTAMYHLTCRAGPPRSWSRSLGGSMVAARAANPSSSSPRVRPSTIMAWGAELN